MRSRITVYLTDSQLEYLRREATRRRRSLSSYVTDCLLDYHSEPASSGPVRHETSPPFSAMLRDAEERIAKEIESRTAKASGQLSKQVMVLTAMLDRFVLSALVHIPEVPEASRPKAVASGERRYANWRQAVEEALDSNGGPSHELSPERSRSGARAGDAA